MKVVTFLKARQIRSRKFPRKKLEKEKQSNMALTMTKSDENTGRRNVHRAQYRQ